MLPTADDAAASASLVGVLDRASGGVPRPCPQCGATHAKAMPEYSTPQWRIGACEACGFVFLLNPPDYEWLTHEFAWEKMWVADIARRRSQSPLLSWVGARTRWRLSLRPGSVQRLLRRTFRPGRVLDVGCGMGETVPPPFVPFGIEVSEAQARAAHARMAALGGAAIQAPAVEGIARFPDKHFTGVVLQGFIEHEKNPKPLLREVRRVLMDDGAVYVRAPNYGSINRKVMGASWCGFRYPDHVNYFTLSSLRQMVASCGFSFRLLSAWRLPFDDLIKAVLHKA